MFLLEQKKRKEMKRKEERQEKAKAKEITKSLATTPNYAHIRAQMLKKNEINGQFI